MICSSIKKLVIVNFVFVENIGFYRCQYIFSFSLLTVKTKTKKESKEEENEMKVRIRMEKV